MVQEHEMFVGKMYFFDESWAKSQGERELTSEDFYWILELDKDLDSIKPIPLTEEWLVKFGFENGTTQDLKVITNATITKNGMREGVWNLYLGHNAIDVNFKYVHQLQNLYFALTGNELQIT